MGKEFDQMLKIQKTVVDGSCSQHKHLLLRTTRHHVKQFSVSVGRAISKVMRFVNDHNFCLLCNLIHQILVLFQKQVGMVDDFEGIETFKDFGDVLLNCGFPNGNSGRCRNDQHNIFAFFFHKTLNEHHANISFTQANTITEERTRAEAKEKAKLLPDMRY